MREKDAFYFPHDSNAKDDPKCILLIEQLGLEGYGIFWVLIETLRDQPGYKYPLALLNALARRFNTTQEKIKVVVSNYGLFTVENDEFFFSESLKRRMEKFDQKRENARLAGIESAKKRLGLNGCSTDVQPMLNEGSTIRRDKKRVNKKIEDKIKEEYTKEFELFYSEYPRPENKHQSFNNWRTCLKKYSVDQLMAACKNYKAAKAGTEIQFLKSSSNFLGREKPFEDFINHTQPEAKQQVQTQPEIIKAPDWFKGG